METASLKLPDLSRFRAPKAGLIALGTIVAVVFFILGAGLRLVTGHITLAPFSDRLSAALVEALPGITVRFDSASLGLSLARDRIDLIVLGARVYDSKGRIIAQAPRADLALSSSALSEGKIDVRRITLVGVQLTLLRTAEGSLRLGVADDKTQPDLIERLREILSKGDGPSTLEALAVRDARLAFYDESSGLFLIAPKTALNLSLSAETLHADLDAAIELSGKRAHIKGDVTIPPNATEAEGNFKLTGLDLEALGRNARTLSALKVAAITVDLGAKVKFIDGRISKACFKADGQGGFNGWGPEGGLLSLGKLHISGAYDAASGRITLSRADTRDGQVNFRLDGGGILRFDDQNILTEAALDAVISDVNVNMPGIFARNLSLARVAIAASYAPETGEAVLQNFTLDGGPFKAQITGKTLFERKSDASPRIDISGKVNSIGIRQALLYWPMTLGGGAREWIDRNIPTGQFGQMSIEVHIPTGALDEDKLAENTVRVFFPFSGVSGTYIRGLPPMTHGVGTGLLSGNTFRADIHTAKIGDIAVSQGAVIISDLSAPVAKGDITAHAEGLVPDILALIDHKPLGYPSRFNIDAADTKGSASVDISTKLPMLRDVSMNDVKVHVVAKTEGLDIAIGKSRVGQGAITFIVDNDRLHATGIASYVGQKLNMDWTEEFNPKGDVSTHLKIDGPMDHKGRSALGVNLGSMLTGPVSIKADITGRRGDLRHADIAINLAKSRLLFAMSGIDKAPGIAANAQLDLTFGPGSLPQSAIMTLNSKALDMAGTMRFTSEGQLAELNLTKVKSTSGNDFNLLLHRGANQSMDITIRGKSMDGTKIAGTGNSGLTKDGKKIPIDPGKDAAKDLADDKFDGPFRISVQLEKLVLREGISVSPFRMETSGIEDRLQAFTTYGEMGQHGNFTGQMENTKDGRKLTLQTGNAGRLIQGMFGLDNVKDGKLSIITDFPGTGDLPGPGDGPDFTAILIAEDFRIQHQPFLARLFAAGSLTGFIDLMRSNGIAVDKLTVPMTSRNGLINIREAHASGPALGFSADGFINRPTNQIGLRGTLAPLYGINSVLGAIPLLGDLLTSRRGEGIIGTTYAVKGDADEPEISVNPLSMLTPGILRRIFEGKIPTSKAVPAPQSKPAEEGAKAPEDLPNQPPANQPPANQPVGAAEAAPEKSPAP